MILATAVTRLRGLAWLCLYACTSPWAFPTTVAVFLPAEATGRALLIIPALASLASLAGFIGVLRNLLPACTARTGYLVLAGFTLFTLIALLGYAGMQKFYPGVAAIIIATVLALFYSLRYYLRENSGYIRCNIAVAKVFSAAFALYTFVVTSKAFLPTSFLLPSLIVISSLETLALGLVLLLLYRQHFEALLDNNESTIRQEQKIATIAPLLNRNRHDLRAPVTDIIGLSELVLGAPLDQDQRVNVLEIQRLARSTLIRINQLFLQQESSPGGDDGFILSEQFALSDLLLECTQYFSSGTSEIILDISPDLPSLWRGDHIKLRQVLLHSLEYILPLAADEPVHMQVSSNEYRQLVIKIVLTGAATAEVIAKQNVNEHIRIASALTHKLSGELRVDYNGQDLQLIASLPLAPGDEQEANEDGIEQLRGKRLLVVDDNPVSCNVLSAYATRAHMGVFTATSYQDALAILRHQSTIGEPVDFCLLDYVMDEIDGMTLARTIRKEQGEHRKTTLLLMSNATESIDPVAAKNCGIKRILEKPLLPNTLFTALASEARYTQAMQEALRQFGNGYPSATNNDFSALSILLVEDNPVSAQIVSAMLRRLSIRPDLAVDSQSAIDLCTDNSYDIIFLDCELPDDSGFATAEKIRALDDRQTGRVYIVALTAYDDPETKKQCIAAGMNKHLGKPIDMFQLESIIRHFLSQQAEPDPGQ